MLLSLWSAQAAWACRLEPRRVPGGVESVTLTRFRALITLAPASRPCEYPGGSRVLVYGTRTGDPAAGRFFQALMTPDEEVTLGPGDHAVVTLTIADGDAPGYLTTGRHFALWGATAGRGIISRQVYTVAGPS